MTAVDLRGVLIQSYRSSPTCSFHMAEAVAVCAQRTTA